MCRLSSGGQIHTGNYMLIGDNIYYTLCDLADIQLADQYNHPSWSVLSPSFEEHERLILVPDGVTCIHPDK